MREIIISILDFISLICFIFAIVATILYIRYPIKNKKKHKKDKLSDDIYITEKFHDLEEISNCGCPYCRPILTLEDIENLPWVKAMKEDNNGKEE